MIEKVQFRNFKAYRSLDLELEPFTVLVGPNASGKTTVLQGLQVASSHIASELAIMDRVSWLEPKFQSFGIDSPSELRVLGKWQGIPGSVELRGAPKTGSHGDVYAVSGRWGDTEFNFLDGEGFLETPPKYIRDIGESLSSTAVVRFEVHQLAKASYSDELIPSILSDGSGLASVLANLKLSQDDVFAELELLLRQIVPAVRRIRIERAEVVQTAVRTVALDEQRHQVSEKRSLWGNKVVLDMKGAKGVYGSEAGEGTLMVLGLLTVLLGPSKPRLVLLDDIELSLHPAAQARLIEALRAILKRDPELQIVATSHSPFILNYLDPKEVRMTFLAENGFARCEKLTAHPEYERWKDLMAPGEFWSTVGEEWIGKLGGAAADE